LLMKTSHNTNAERRYVTPHKSPTRHTYMSQPYPFRALKWQDVNIQGHAAAAAAIGL
jgi:hypothetical protein